MTQNEEFCRAVVQHGFGNATAVYGFNAVSVEIFETMAMGRPIIRGVRGESRTIVQAVGAAIDMEPESETDLVEGLLRLADDAAFRESLSQSSRAYVLDHYDRNRQAARMLGVFEDLTRS